MIYIYTLAADIDEEMLILILYLGQYSSPERDCSPHRQATCHPYQQPLGQHRSSQSGSSILWDSIDPAYQVSVAFGTA